MMSSLICILLVWSLIFKAKVALASTFENESFIVKSKGAAAYTAYCMRNYSKLPLLGIKKVCWVTVQLDQPTGMVFSSSHLYYSPSLRDKPIAIEERPENCKFLEKLSFCLQTEVSNQNFDSLTVKLYQKNPSDFFLYGPTSADQAITPENDGPKTFTVKRDDKIGIFPSWQGFEKSKLEEFQTLKDHKSTLKLVRLLRDKRQHHIKGIYVTFGKLYAKQTLEEKDLIYKNLHIKQELVGQNIMKEWSKAQLCLQRWYYQPFNKLFSPIVAKKGGNSGVIESLHFLPPQSPPFYHDFQIISRNQRYGVEFTPTEFTISEDLRIAKQSQRPSMDKDLFHTRFIVRINKDILETEIEGKGGMVPLFVKIYRSYNQVESLTATTARVEHEDRILMYRLDGRFREANFIQASLCSSLECVAESLYRNGTCVLRVVSPPNIYREEETLNEVSLLDYNNGKEAVSVTEIVRSPIDELNQKMHELKIEDEGEGETETAKCHKAIVSPKPRYPSVDNLVDRLQKSLNLNNSSSNNEYQTSW